jgi:hypothetical protein
MTDRVALSLVDTGLASTAEAKARFFDPTLLSLWNNFTDEFNLSGIQYLLLIIQFCLLILFNISLATVW